MVEDPEIGPVQAGVTVRDGPQVHPLTLHIVTLSIEKSYNPRECEVSSPVCRESLPVGIKNRDF